MPTYEYECRNCLLRFEVKKRFSDNGASFCPSCGAEGHLVFSPVPIIFKGPGFYVTDNRKNDDHRREEGDGNKSDWDEKKRAEKTDKQT